MTTRRRFLGHAAAALAAPTILPSGLLGQNAPSKRIAMGFIGMGNRGMGVMEAFLNHPEVQGVAVCDVDDHHFQIRGDKRSRDYGRTPGKAAMEAAHAKRSDAASWKGATAYEDFRELLARDDIDAVMVATPDHWHGLITMAALQSGKDVYCEKPVTHKYAEGHAIHREVAKRKAVFQVGSQQRSEAVFQQAVEIVRNGLIGKVSKVEVGLPTGHDQPDGDPTLKDPPAHLNYDFWCGPAEVLPYMEARNHWSWRWTLAYGGGQLMDWIGHHNDIAHWGLGMDQSGPVSVEARDWVFPKTEIYDSPVSYDVVSKYEGGVEVVISSRLPMGAKWIGEDGWVHVTRGALTASNPAWVEKGFVAGEWKTIKTPGHQRNFIDCVLSREDTIANAETAHRSITPGHLAYLSHAIGAPIQWDPKEEKVVGNEEAQQRLMSLPYRGDWKLGA
ncbi:MAG TPA: Gfo/Idh/MocA family oxidoreductase [Bacteroidia bacterium]|nr:Gfo/Idh/MocA family oxidoreductase [Bacteroidia bacterium]